MLDQEAWAIAAELLRAELARREPVVIDELAKVQSDFVKAGTLRSSGMAAAILDLCAKEVEIRTDEAWKIVRGLVQATKKSPSNEDIENLSRGFDRLFSTYCYNQQLNRVDETCQRLGIEPSWIRHQDFESRALNARSRVASQIKEFVWSLRKAAESESISRPAGAWEYWSCVLKRAWREAEFKQPWKLWTSIVTPTVTVLVEHFIGRLGWHSVGLAMAVSIVTFVLVNLATFTVAVFSIPPKLTGEAREQ